MCSDLVGFCDICPDKGNNCNGCSLKRSYDTAWKYHIDHLTMPEEAKEKIEPLGTLEEEVVWTVGKWLEYKVYIMHVFHLEERAFIEPDIAGGWDIWKDDKYIAIIESFSELKRFFGEPYEKKEEEVPYITFTQEEHNTAPDEELPF